METVRDKARALRERYWEKKVHLRGIIEFSNHCRQNCLYCGLRRDNQRLDRYRLDYKTIFACAQDVAALGFGTVVLQSGEDPALDVAGAAGFAALVERIKSELGLAVTLSLGERKPREYALLRKAGADRYLLKMEIMDAALYASLRPGKKLEDRRSAFFRLQDLGYESGTGLIVGLPGDAEASLEESLAELALWQPAMLSISPFTPQSETPLRAAPGCGANAALHAMALARIHMPRAHIPVTSALNLHGEAVRRAGLNIGDVLMPSLTPAPVREAYAIYAGKNVWDKNPMERAREVSRDVEKDGFVIAAGPGGLWRAPEQTPGQAQERQFSL